VLARQPQQQQQQSKQKQRSDHTTSISFQIQHEHLGILASLVSRPPQSSSRAEHRAALGPANKTHVRNKKHNKNKNRLTCSRGRSSDSTEHSNTTPTF
jgi:hypothetical protein